ncbi:MAG: hypothetical protein WC279_14490 [Sulfurimonas sp.]|jgi:hypothetical protein|uniref:hypothetical protein n=1 Tax=Sulfurimonas sp. TaxID=2022749 RepID=UPI003567C435
MADYKEPQYVLKALERQELQNDYPNPPELENEKWYFSILDDKLKYGKWLQNEKCFIDVQGNKFNVYNSDILTGKTKYIATFIHVVGTGHKYKQ